MLWLPILHHPKSRLAESILIAQVIKMHIHIRLACLEDIPILENLIPESARTL
jgi:hypothetical protein